MALAFLLTVGTTACTTAGDVPAEVPAPAATQGDPRFQQAFRHEVADVDGVRTT